MLLSFSQMVLLRRGLRRRRIRMRRSRLQRLHLRPLAQPTPPGLLLSVLLAQRPGMLLSFLLPQLPLAQPAVRLRQPD